MKHDADRDEIVEIEFSEGQARLQYELRGRVDSDERLVVRCCVRSDISDHIVPCDVLDGRSRMLIVRRVEVDEVTATAGDLERPSRLTRDDAAPRRARVKLSRKPLQLDGRDVALVGLREVHIVR